MKRSYFSPYCELNPKERAERILAKMGKEAALKALSNMVLVRHFETRGEYAYQHGLIGGFFHAYTGEEAIATSVVSLFGCDHWYVGFYRCHALALLLGASPDELMAELYGRKSGIAKGRGGSMHLYAPHMLGGFAIVGGHLPIAIGAAFSLKYQKKKGHYAICFLGEGAVAQGAYHESLNLAALWGLPVLFVIENNQWGMGTHVSRAIAVEQIAEKQAPAYGMRGYTLDGTNFLECYSGFEHIKNEMEETGRPALVECVCDRFRGHSISDPGLYRTKEELTLATTNDPIVKLRTALEEAGLLTAEQFQEIDRTQKERVLAAMEFAEKSPWPSPATLEEEVYAP